MEYSVSSVHSVSGPWGYGVVRAPRPRAALAESRRVDAPTCGGRCESPRSRAGSPARPPSKACSRSCFLILGPGVNFCPFYAFRKVDNTYQNIINFLSCPQFTNGGLSP